MSNQLYTDGDVITDDNGNEFEVTGVSYQTDNNGERINHSYHLRLKSELDAERKAEADRLAAEEKARKDAEELAALDPAERLARTGNT